MAEARAERGDFRVRSRTASWALERAYVAAPLLLRLTLGPMLLAHGLQKLFNMSASAAGFEAMGFAPGMLWVTPVMLAETLGGAALILGLFTRLGAAANLISQLVAMLLVHLPNGFFMGEQPGIEFTLVNAGALAALLVLGGGAISLDHLIHRRNDRLETRRTGTTIERTGMEPRDERTVEPPGATPPTTTTTPPGTTPRGTKI